jgi:diketogulonate reductase-like aldo/keto reductase
MAKVSRLLNLNNGVQMPALGLGVYQSSPGDTIGAVEVAIAQGYRLIDTASSYGNEREVGEGLRRSGIDRREVFVTTKLWISDYGYDKTLIAFDASLRRLRLDYVDLYLIHWPVPTDVETSVASYRAAEKLLAEGTVRAIGVCNHGPRHLADLIARTNVMPAVNQVELHPYLTQQKVRDTDAQYGIITQSWSPIGGVHIYKRHRPNNARNALADPVVTALAARHGKTPAQVILRWHLQHGLSAIPKSVRLHRIAENFDVFGFSLTASDVSAIDRLDTGIPGGPDPELVNTTLFPFVVDNS